MAREPTNKRTILIFPSTKVDLVYYFAIHKEDESKNKNIGIEVVPPRAWRSLKARSVLFSASS
jgi:hypothetical protein